MFTVTGTITRGNSRVPYRVGIYPPGSPDHPGGGVGCAVGSAGALALLSMHAGQEVAVTPTGPTVTIDPDDPASTLAALYALTTVRAVDGDDIPDLAPPDEGGVVY